MIEIDVTADIEAAEKKLFRYERQAIPKAISSALNKTRNNARSAVNRKIARRTGLKVKEINASEWTINSTQFTQFATLTMRRRPFNLYRFLQPRNRSFLPGAFRNQPGPKANPWRKSRIFKGAFIIRGAGHGRPIVVTRTSKNRKPLKAVYGPSLHTEFNRPIMRRFMRLVVLKRFRLNFWRDLSFYVSRIQ